MTVLWIDLVVCASLWRYGCRFSGIPMLRFSMRTHVKNMLVHILPRSTARTHLIILNDTAEQCRVQPLVGVFDGSFPYVEGLELPASVPHDGADQDVAPRRQLVDIRTVDEHALGVSRELRPAVVLAAVFCSSLLLGERGDATHTTQSNNLILPRLT